MKIRENSSQHFILTDEPWWAPIVGVIIAGFCFWSATAQIAEYSSIHRLGTVIVGLIFLGVFTLAIRKSSIHFDRTSGLITRTTAPLLPIGHIHLFRPRSESRPIDTFLFAFLERQIRHISHRSTSTSVSPKRHSFCLALATGEIPEDWLIGKIGFMNSPDRDKIRWLVGYNASMKRMKAISIVNAVNQWLGTSPPLDIASGDDDSRIKVSIF